ncbi:hypothetical protein ACFQJC_04830 [Haloferax namakaokahaiae]|uniref:Uncharacterized protein n=1 Tax=Haloferax namakaokahaiae TaxID=1748331 RepID=A0ABD5ZCA4_9EURY
MSCASCGSPCKGRKCRDCELMDRFDDDHETLMADIDADLDEQEEDEE